MRLRVIAVTVRVMVRVRVRVSRTLTQLEFDVLRERLRGDGGDLGVRFTGFACCSKRLQ